MPRVSKAFFLCAVVYGICGMGLGMYMGASENHTLMPVHAHVNLLGWVSLAIMGGFYALAGERAPTKLAWVNFGLSNIGVLLVGPLLARLLLTGDKAVIPFMVLGEVALVLGMIVFGLAVLRTQPKASNLVAA
jgi:hypothetical protein